MRPRVIWIMERYEAYVDRTISGDWNHPEYRLEKIEAGASPEFPPHFTDEVWECEDEHRVVVVREAAPPVSGEDAE